jgi:hypothetical protein
MEKKSEYQIFTGVHEGILEITLTGEITAYDVQTLQSEVIDVVISNNLKNILIDVCGLKGRFGYSEAYHRVRNYPSNIHQVNTAVVDIPEHADYESFHEITATNVGLSLKCFTDIDDAKVWLKSKEKKIIS